MSRATFVALACVFLAVGAAMARLALRHGLQRRAFLAHSVATAGRVVAFRELRDGDRDRPSLFPQVEFRTSTGQLARFESEAGSEAPQCEVGDRVRIRYRADAPNEAELDEFLSLWGATLVFGALAAAFGSVAVAMLAGWIPQ